MHKDEDNDIMLPGAIDRELDALSYRFSDRDSLTVDDAKSLHRKVNLVFSEIEDGILAARPMLLIIFDDSWGPSFVCTPSITVKTGDDIEKVDYFHASSLEHDQLRRTLGERVTTLCHLMERLSRIVKDAGFDSLVDFREMSEENVSISMCPEEQISPH